MVRIRQRWSLVLLGLVLGVGLVACKKEGASGSGDKSSEASSGGDLALLPADSEIVIGMNLGQMQQSALWKQFVEPKLATADAQQMLSEFKAKCGTDPMKMISSITVGVRGLSDKPSAVAVAHGLDKAKILDCIEKTKADMAKDGGEVTRDGDVVLFKTDRGQPVAVQFTSDSTAVIVAGANANAAGVKAVLGGGGGSLKSSAAFLEMYKKVKTTDSIWGFASGKVMERIPMGLKLTAAYGSINVTDSLTVDTRVRFDKPEAATQAAEMANAQTKQATQYVDKAEATAEGNDLHVSVIISGQKLAQLIPMLGMLGAMMPGMGGN
jgi:hypothetical protein